MVNQPPYHEVYIINVNKWRVDLLDMTAHHILCILFGSPNYDKKQTDLHWMLSSPPGFITVYMNSRR